MVEDQKFKRWNAIKSNLKTIKLGEYVDEGPEKPNYLLSSEGKKIYRLNLMATVLEIKTTGTVTTFLVDDGSEQIMLRFFEDNKFKENFNVGDSILIIGRIREFNQEKYITPDIVKKIDSRWLKVRALELNFKNEEKCIASQQGENDFYEHNQEIKETTTKYKKSEEKIVFIDKSEEHFLSEEIIVEDVPKEEIELEEEIPPAEKLFKLIKDLDQGEGVMIEDLIEKSNIDGAEKIIEIMVQNGEIFQNLPGRVKVL
ncbi:MAG: OB-fold nucleic acid binding domain-containing protein [archaeon]|nr:hypothetical protein [Nanoarchaeota archaeon]